MESKTRRRRTSTPKDVPITLRVSRETADRIEAVCDATGMAKAAVVREALKTWLQEAGKRIPRRS